METGQQHMTSKLANYSPFRYPGGKTWLLPSLRAWIASLGTEINLFVEPFAGGAVASLAAIFENWSDHALLAELDMCVASVWETVLGQQSEWLQDRVASFIASNDSVNDVLSAKPESGRELAFWTLLKNRTSYGGILAGGAGRLLAGENGRGVASRWYAKTISDRIARIRRETERMTFVQTDAFDIIFQFKDEEKTVFFIDPPYTAGGKKSGARLYAHSEIDHVKLFSTCRDLRGDFLMTHANEPHVRDLAKQHGFQTKPVAMRSNHHARMTEMLVGRDLSWFRPG